MRCWLSALGPKDNKGQKKLKESGNELMSESEILEKFTEIVAKSLRVDPSQITLDKHLDELGAESLDLIEITMEAESRFNIWLPERSILQTAIEVFGPGVLENDGLLTEAGKHLLKRRLPDSDAKWFQGDVSVRDLQRYFLKISTWLQMIDNFIRHTPHQCPACSGELAASTGFRLKCQQCSQEVTVRSGEELNREWVQSYYETDYLPSLQREAAPNAAQTAAQSA